MAHWEYDESGKVAHKVPEQKMILVKNNDFRELELLLKDGWEVKKFQPVAGEPNGNTSIYVLLDKYWVTDQRMILINNNDFRELEDLIEKGFLIQYCKPIPGWNTSNPFVYIWLEK